MHLNPHAEAPKDKVHEAHEALLKAEEIKKDKSLMGEVEKHRKTLKSGRPKSIADIRKMSNEVESPLEEKASGEEMDNGDLSVDHTSSKEHNEKRVKNSAHPTIVGKVMK